MHCPLKFKLIFVFTVVHNLAYKFCPIINRGMDANQVARNGMIDFVKSKKCKCNKEHIMVLHVSCHYKQHVAVLFMTQFFMLYHTFQDLISSLWKLDGIACLIYFYKSNILNKYNLRLNKCNIFRILHLLAHVTQIVKDICIQTN